MGTPTIIKTQYGKLQGIHVVQFLSGKDAEVLSKVSARGKPIEKYNLTHPIITQS